MKKSIIVAVAAAALAVSTAGCAQPGYNNGYNRGYANNNYNRGYANNNGWNYAAAAVGGAIVGGVIGAVLGSNQPQQAYGPAYAPQPVYVYPQACQTVRIPQYDQYGRLVQYVQMCAN